MLGRGLESLIPKRDDNNDGLNNDHDFYDEEEIDSGLGENNLDDSKINNYLANELPNANSFSPRNEIHNDFEKNDEFLNPESNIIEGSLDNIQNELKISDPVFHIEVDKIEFNPYQPRKDFDEQSLRELASSIREYGILQPLVVMKEEEVSDYGSRVKYILIAGQRRLMASRLLGLNTVPAIIRETRSNTEALEIAIVENIQRSDLSIIETARAYARLSDEFGLTQREIATRMGKSRESVANALRLLSLPKDTQEALSQRKINESHARLLMQIEDAIKHKQLLEDIIRLGLSTRELKKRMNNKIKADNEGSRIDNRDFVDPKMQYFEKYLSELLGAPVKVDFHGGSGKIVIHFYSEEEVEGIVQKMKKEEDVY